MKLKHAILLVPLAMAGCLDDSPTSAAIEQRVFNVLGGLETGEALTAEGAAAETIYLTGGEAGSRYLYVPFWATSREGENILDVEVTGTNLSGASSSASVAPSRAPFLGPTDPAAPRLDFGFHDRLRLSERALSGLIPGARAYRNHRLRASNAAQAAAPAVGDLLRLNASPYEACTNPLYRTARVMAVTDRAIVVADTANPPSSFTQADFRSVGLAFDTLVWRVSTRAFGEPYDMDANNRVIIFYTRVVNELTPPGSRGYVGGFFWVRDLFPRTEQPPRLAGCGASNMAEMFYMLAPDPQGVVNGNPRSEELVKRTTVGVTGHEFEHLINASRRIYVNEANQLEEAWLDEGLAHIAEELLFYEASGLRPRQNININHIRSSQQTVDAFNNFLAGNVGRYWTYLENPTAESLMGVDAELETRGAAWSYLRYVADQRELGESFFGQLVNSRSSGVANLRTVLGTDPVDLMQTWTVSVYADDYVAGAAPVYQQPSWNWQSLMKFFNDDVFPLRVLTLGSGGTTVGLKGGGAAFIEIRPTARQNSVITIRANSQAPSDSLRISVLRVQ